MTTLCSCGGILFKKAKKININTLKAECKRKGIKQSFGIDDVTILLHRLGRDGEKTSWSYKECSSCGRQA